MRVFQERPWLFGKRVDLLAFGGSATASLGLLAVGAWAGLLNADTPEWLWVVAVLAVDVAHVWSTLFRVYLDPVELRRRLGLYLALPAICYAVGVALHSVSSMTFWRVLAYLALFLNPDDDVSLLRVIGTPPRGIGQGTVASAMEFSIAHECSVYDALNDLLFQSLLSKKAIGAIGRFQEFVERFAGRSKFLLVRGGNRDLLN